jgi:hypothetical protein
MLQQVSPLFFARDATRRRPGRRAFGGDTEGYDAGLLRAVDFRFVKREEKWAPGKKEGGAELATLGP